jgi:hypothetical protein
MQAIFVAETHPANNNNNDNNITHGIFISIRVFSQIELNIFLTLYFYQLWFESIQLSSCKTLIRKE